MAESVLWTPEAHFGTNILTYVSGSVVKTARFLVTSSMDQLTLEGALDIDSQVNVTTGGAACWVPVNDKNAMDGRSCARSGLGNHDNDSESWIELTVNGKGSLAFWCKTSCEHDDDNTFTWDRLEIIVDGVDQSDWRMDGVSQWVQRAMIFDTDGAHVVKIVYAKDGSEYDGEDCAWIDGVVWKGEDPEEPLPPLAAPVINPATGSSFTKDTCTVTITCATPQAVIYFSMNGGVPEMAECNRYKGPFTISQTTTVKAVAVRGEERSACISATLTKVDPTYVDVKVGKDVTGRDELVTIPASWVTEFLVQRFGAGKEEAFRQQFGVDLAAAMAKPTGKVGQNGKLLTVWDDFVAGTDPTDSTSHFTASIALVDGNIVIAWSPNLNEGVVNRIYRVKSKAKLTDKWSCPPVEGHSFFTVEVDLPDGKTSTDDQGYVGKVSESSCGASCL